MEKEKSLNPWGSSISVGDSGDTDWYCHLQRVIHSWIARQVPDRQPDPTDIPTTQSWWVSGM